MNKSLLLSTLLFICINSCNKANLKVESDQPVKANDGKYDSHFPLTPIDSDIAKIEQTVKLITNLTFYQAYDFAFKSKITSDKLSDRIIKELAINTYIVEQPASGTATLIEQNLNKIALLTCEHIVSAPDTLINYHLDESGSKTSYIQSIALKTRESINIITLPGLKNIHILASDEDTDAAIVMATLDPLPIFPLPVFSYPMGKAEELNWGTFVYVIGFPYGKKLISTAIVSDPRRDKRNGFIIDATMHKGASGGIILALRDGAPNFELVGMASALSAEREFILRPDDASNGLNIDFGQLYKGNIILDKRMKINYGIVYAISVEAIQDFIHKNRDKISKAGFNL
ncbi:MAG: trypsin-like peptidase domain-containing protein [Calditrichaceae bacterium]|nr:trypsin-like peptidase domain-containing protein [Calditrichaceae bacterium]